MGCWRSSVTVGEEGGYPEFLSLHFCLPVFSSNAQFSAFQQARGIFLLQKFFSISLPSNLLEAWPLYSVSGVPSIPKSTYLFPKWLRTLLGLYPLCRIYYRSRNSTADYLDLILDGEQHWKWCFCVLDHIHHWQFLLVTGWTMQFLLCIYCYSSSVQSKW